jgi:hypothetical protein
MSLILLSELPPFEAPTRKANNNNQKKGWSPVFSLYFRLDGER